MTKDIERSKQSGIGPSIDWSILDTLAALGKPGAPDLRIRLLEAFLSTSPPLMKELKRAVAEPNTLSIAKAAHSLKSSSMNLGATALGSLCSELEKLGRGNALHGATDLLAQADDELKLVVDAFEGLLEKLGRQSP